MRDYLGVHSDNLDAASAEFKHDSVLTCPEMKRLHKKAYPYFLNMGFGMNYFFACQRPFACIRLAQLKPLEGGPRKVQNVPKLSATVDVHGHSWFSAWAWW